MKITAKAYAKINWSLGICGDRPDGYHDLDMLMQRIELCDELTFESARWLTLSIDGQKLPTGDRNLVIRSANALNDVLGTKHGARITLKKNIPSRAGLGGGSADSAATLIALNRLWNLNLPLRTLARIGKKLGADVPYCLCRGLARVQGIGEIITPLDKSPVYPMVIVTPGGGLSTPAVFQEWNKGNHPMTQVDNAALADALVSGDHVRAQALSHNDLEAPAICLMPEIGALIEKFRSLGAKYTRMTGSGSTVFAVFESDEAALSAAEQVPGAIFTRTIGGND